MNYDNTPLVSCMMLTHNRWRQFKNAVKCFIHQTYPNVELIIINSGTDKYYRKVCDWLSQYNFDFTHIHTTKQPLGALRNMAIDNSNGEYIICFDDDDIHHYQRIVKQIDLCLTSNVQATLLRNFIALEKRIFSRKSSQCSILKGLEGSVLFKKTEIRYPTIDQGEDTSFMDMYSSKYNVAIIDEPYELYEYIYWGNNTVNLKHFRTMVDSNKGLR